MNLKEMLGEKVPARLKPLLPRAFDIVGSREKAVAIVEIDEKLKRYEKKIAKAIMGIQKNVKAVLSKKSSRKGAFRLSNYELIAGIKNTEVVHKEYGMRLKLDPKKVFFSVREGSERMDAAKLVKKGETVMVFFAGVGPYPILIDKISKAKRTIGIEINPRAIRYFRENIVSNKCKNVEAIEGDVRCVAGEFYGKCNRIFMPCMESFNYLKEAIRCTEKGGIAHFYCIADEKKISDWVEKVISIARHEGRSAKVIGHRFVLPWGPRIWKTRIDFRVR
jgi:tRNA (guanine37-N1)-methyltransferase